MDGGDTAEWQRQGWGSKKGSFQERGALGKAMLGERGAAKRGCPRNGVRWGRECSRQGCSLPKGVQQEQSPPVTKPRQPQQNRSGRQFAQSNIWFRGAGPALLEPPRWARGPR